MIYFDYEKHLKRQHKKNTLEILEKLAFNIVNYLFFCQWNVSENSVKYILKRVKGRICQKDIILFICLFNEWNKKYWQIPWWCPIIVFMVLSKVFNELHFLNVFVYYLFGCIGSLQQHAGSSLHHVGSLIAVHGLFSWGALATECAGFGSCSPLI